MATWDRMLAEEKSKPYFAAILDFLEKEKVAGKIIYPPMTDIFNAFIFTPLDDVKVVILGQDPYHGPEQAHGLCFSIRPGIPAPPSLKNILKEISSDIGAPTSNHGNLEKLAKQGVMLLNTVLTVQAGHPHSHAGIGWEDFTDAVIRILNNKKEGLVFLLWGNDAHKKGNLIDRARHHVFEAAHPSPLSAYRGFFGCKHFSEANQILKQQGKEPIDWSL